MHPLRCTAPTAPGQAAARPACAPRRGRAPLAPAAAHALPSQPASCGHQPQLASAGLPHLQQEQQPRQPAPSLPQVLAGVAAAAVLLTAQQPALAYVDDAVTTVAVEEYGKLESAGKFAAKGTSSAPPKALEDFRQRYKFRRMGDGRVQLRSSKGEWYQCRLDMEVPGSMLLRDPKGKVFAIQTEALQQVGAGALLLVQHAAAACHCSGTRATQPRGSRAGPPRCGAAHTHRACARLSEPQIDLSDDLVVLMMFADGEWEKQMSAMEYVDDKGKVQQLQLEDKDFREVRQQLGSSGLWDRRCHWRRQLR